MSDIEVARIRRLREDKARAAEAEKKTSKSTTSKWLEALTYACTRTGVAALVVVPSTLAHAVFTQKQNPYRTCLEHSFIASAAVLFGTAATGILNASLAPPPPGERRNSAHIAGGTLAGLMFSQLWYSKLGIGHHLLLKYRFGAMLRGALLFYGFNWIDDFAYACRVYRFLEDQKTRGVRRDQIAPHLRAEYDQHLNGIAIAPWHRYKYFMATFDPPAILAQRVDLGLPDYEIRRRIANDTMTTLQMKEGEVDLPRIMEALDLDGTRHWKSNLYGRLSASDELKYLDQVVPSPTSEVRKSR